MGHSEDGKIGVRERTYGKLCNKQELQQTDGHILMLHMKITNVRVQTIKVRPYISPDPNSPEPSPIHKVHPEGEKEREPATSPVNLQPRNATLQASLIPGNCTPPASLTPGPACHRPARRRGPALPSPSPKPVPKTPPPPSLSLLPSLESWTVPPSLAPQSGPGGSVPLTA